MEKIYFTLEEANALIPYLEDQMHGLKELKTEIIRLVDRIESEGIDLDDMLSGRDIPEKQLPYRSRFEELGDKVDDVIFEIQEKGPIVKDIEVGLVDFYAKIKGEDAFLCWKLGEEDIQSWHGINEGFSERESLMERSILENVTVLH